MALTRAQIQTAFQNSLGRAASANEENSYFSVSQSGALADGAVINSISNSREADLNADPVVRFYQAAFGRVPDQAGLDNATDYVRSFGATAQTYQSLANMFVTSPEFTNRFGTSTTVDNAYVTALYNTILGRTPSAGEVDAFVSGSNGYTTRGQVLYAISQSQEAITNSNDAVNGFLNNAATGTAVYTGSLYTAGNGQPTAPGAGGATFTLTTGLDNLTGTAGNDSYIGTVNQNNGGGQTDTLNNGDAINGGAGTDKLTIFSTGNIPTGASSTNVEQIFVQNATNASSISANQFAGATQFWAQSSTANQTFTDLNAATQTAGIKGTVGAGVDLTFTYANVAGNADSASLALDNAKLTTLAAAGAIPADPSNVTIEGIETLNVSGAGTGVSLTDTTLKTLNVSATGTTSITANGSANLTTINASASTGNVTVTATNNAAVAFTGGAGNDKLVVGGTLTNADVINGGAGTDTVSISGDDLRANGSTGGEALKGVNTLTSIEQLEFTGATGAQVNGDTFTNAAITKLIFNTTGNDVIELSGARTYAFGSDNAGNATFAARAGATTLNLALEGTDLNAAGTAGTAQVGTVVANGQTQINLASSGVAGVGANVVGEIDLASNTTVTLSGSQALTINAIKTVAGANFAATDTGGIVNAGSLAAKLTIVGSTGVDVITVGTGGSVVTGGTGADQVTFGSGVDTANFTSGTSESGVLTPAANAVAAGNGPDGIAGNADDVAAAPAVARSIGQIDTITGFTAGAGGDHLAVTGGTAVNTYTAVTAGQQTNITAAASLTAAIDAAADAHTVTGWTAFTYGGSTYALNEAAASNNTGYIAGDNVVKLAGVDVATLTAANFGPVA